MKMKTIYLIRHGETEWTLSGQHTGSTDLPLTENGCAQAKALGEFLKTIKFKAVFVSPLKRSVETCALAGLLNRARIDPNLVEWNYGKYEGMKTTEIQKIDPDWTIFTKGAPEGESVEDVGQRADKILLETESIDGNIAIFSHGHFMRVLAARWLKLPPSDGRLFSLATASISLLGYERMAPVILKWNLTSI